jgi:hypothetical protein
MGAIDPQVLLCLLAVRLQGGSGVAAGADVFKKGLKEVLPEALEQGWLVQRKESVLPGGRKKADVLDLTDAGRQVLAEHVDSQAPVNNAALEEVREDLDRAWKELRESIRGPGSMTTKTKKASVSTEDVGALAKAVSELAARVQKLEETVQEASGAAILERIDRTFQALLARLGAEPQADPAIETPSKEAPTEPPPLRVALKKAYDRLCHFLEFSSGLVELPRLYHETKALVPELKVSDFHKELESLWSQRVLELKVLNEVRGAREADKGIRRGDNLYYFVLWKKGKSE